MTSATCLASLRGSDLPSAVRGDLAGVGEPGRCDAQPSDQARPRVHLGARRGQDDDLARREDGVDLREYLVGQRWRRREDGCVARGQSLQVGDRLGPVRLLSPGEPRHRTYLLVRELVALAAHAVEVDAEPVSYTHLT